MNILRIFRNPPPKRSDIVVGFETVLGSAFAFENRGDQNEVRLSIGSQSYINCAIVLERKTGKVSIGDRTYLGGGSTIICATDIQIGSDVLMAWGVTIVDHDSHSIHWKDRADDVRNWRIGLSQGGLPRASELKNWAVVPTAPIKIDDKVWIGFNAIILKGITIGEGAVVAAGSVVTKDAPPYTVVAGNPAKIVRELSQDEK